MPEKEGIEIGKLPGPFFEKVVEELATSSVGFVRVESSPTGDDAVLLGSGTLVTDGKVHAILTAHHVLEILPRKGRLGLILSQTPVAHTVDIDALEYRKIGRGNEDSEGPDLGAVILAPSIVGAIKAKKKFYNLLSRRDRMLQSPPDLHDGVWLVNGFLGERTIEERGRDGYGRVKGFFNYTGAGGPDDPATLSGEHDYYFFPVSLAGRAGAPTSFGGMSGGGLWQVTIVRDKAGTFHPKDFSLSGVIFYQEPTTDSRYGVKCHGRVSIYRVAYEAMGFGK